MSGILNTPKKGAQKKGKRTYKQQGMMGRVRRERVKEKEWGKRVGGRNSGSLWLIIKQAPRPKAVEPGPDYLRIYLKVRQRQGKKEKEREGKVATPNRTFSVFLFVFLFSGCCFCF